MDEGNFRRLWDEHSLYDYWECNLPSTDAGDKRDGLKGESDENFDGRIRRINFGSSGFIGCVNDEP